jgi:2-amino-4-hydroxy-6-hydroxymethyldihydropteridine diphosphokinase
MSAKKGSPMRVGIALGSNLGDRVGQLRAAVAAIRAFAEPPILLSHVYETAPVDCPPGSPAFLNAAMEIGFSGGIHDLLRHLQAIEQAQDRPAIHGRNTPRTVDLDILYANDLALETPELTLPHPRLMERVFVLRPLCDFAPNRTLPGQLTSFATQLNHLSDSSVTQLDTNLDTEICEK